HRGLRIARGERRQPFGPAHDAVPVLHDVIETLPQPLALSALALQQRDLLGVFPRPHQVEAEVGLEALLLKVELDQWRADPLRQRRTEDGIEQRAPDQIARDRVFVAEYMQAGCSGKS